MLQSLAIFDFRAFEHLEIPSLPRINLITGANGAGKTCLLEALYLLIGEGNPALASKIQAFRGLERYEGNTDEIEEWLWASLFKGYDMRGTPRISAQLSGRDAPAVSLELRVISRPFALVASVPPSQAHKESNWSGSRALEAEYHASDGSTRICRLYLTASGLGIEPVPSMPVRPGFMLTTHQFSFEEDAKLFGELERSHEPYDLLEAVRIVEPRLTRIRTILSPGGTMLWGDMGLATMLPLAMMGDGLARLTSILLRIAAARNGTVLIDEVDSGLYHRLLPGVWKAIIHAARRFNVQVFATTHSWECITAAHESLVEDKTYDLQLLRLERTPSGMRAVTYDKEMLATAIEAGLEVR